MGGPASHGTRGTQRRVAKDTTERFPDFGLHESSTIISGARKGGARGSTCRRAIVGRVGYVMLCGAAAFFCVQFFHCVSWDSSRTQQLTRSHRTGLSSLRRHFSAARPPGIGPTTFISSLITAATSRRLQPMHSDACVTFPAIDRAGRQLLRRA